MLQVLLKNIRHHSKRVGIPHFIALHFIVLCRYRGDFLGKLEVCGNPVIKKVYWHHFPTAFAHLVSVSHFGNSHRSKFFIIIMFVIVVCDQ